MAGKAEMLWHLYFKSVILFLMTVELLTTKDMEGL